jgi:PKD repeat protein
MKPRMFVLLTGIVLAASVLSSCKKTPAPTAEIFSTIDKYTVTFNPTVTNADTYSWNFGDGSAVSTVSNPVHTYESFGDYTVVLTVKGEGGEFIASKTISIAATSLKDLLTGGLKATAGKTWIVSRGYTPGEDGAGPVMNELPVVLPSAENVLDIFGLGAEYDNEYTFYFDGTYKMNLKNGQALAGAVYGVLTGTIVGDPVYDIGMCIANYTAPATATWTSGTADFSVDAITDPMTSDVPPVHAPVVFTGKTWVSFSEGAFFGILDFPTTVRFIIKEITPDKMKVAMLLCGYGYDTEHYTLPTNLIHLTFEVKK